ncbi:uncharacterized protein A4U43_UnF7860 [Asparagus officinalis]|uniref:F-actin-capping protein subunit alpha n=1 Tax=Asparagus officinalis TaxID=4686 RepID=A0A1R3L627_ASPOF|nr:uncharacterized protein A4U43_UnF7860 [Asparagus officinalis]
MRSERSRRRRSPSGSLPTPPPARSSTKHVRSILGDDEIYEISTAEAFPAYDKAHFLALEMPHRGGDVIISAFGEVDQCNYLDPGTAQVATVDHVNNGIWRSIWSIEFKDDLQAVELKGKLQVGAHYFEKGNVQLDSNNECNDSTIIQSSKESAVVIISMIRHHEAGIRHLLRHHI